jgi:hypothetical protein
MVLEQRWTQVPPALYEQESRLVAEDERFATADAINTAAGSPGEVLALLEDERATRPDEPLWKGVAGMSVAGRSVRVEMRPAVEPALLPVEGTESVSVACHLYHPPEGYGPALH